MSDPMRLDSSSLHRGPAGMLLGVDAVRESNVLPDSYGAEYGKRTGGKISIVTSSGTDQLHGDLFEYVRNNIFDARNFFDQTAATLPFKRNQFGSLFGRTTKERQAVPVRELRRFSTAVS